MSTEQETETEVEVDLSEFQDSAEFESDGEQQQEQEYSEVELEAIQHGWNPEGVEGKRNLTAEEFMDRKPLYDDLTSQKKQIKKLQEGMEALKKHNATIAQREREKLIKELKQAKKLALEQENYDAVVELDDRIAAEKAAGNEDETQVSNVAFESFVEENPWYTQDPELKQFADEIGTGHYKNNPNKSLEEVYEYVTKRVKKAFPEKFGNPAREKPSPVEGARKGRASTKQKYSAKDLPDEHRQIMRTLVRSGAMSEQEYLKQYFE